MIDLRSDTVTKPSAAMREAMLKAEVGDDVFGEDPTIKLLESKAAALFGMEAAIFCPSGTMTNQIAIKCHTQPGDEVICEKLSHIYQYEGGGIAFNAGCSVNLIDGNYGRITAAQVQEVINDKDDIHKAVTSLVSLENTANRGGGTCYDFEEFHKIKKVCVANGLKFHLDGARIFNAIIAKNEKPAAYGKVFDSISVCLSKGLGAPVGSVLLGTKEMITRATRIRKIFGGGMRQAGILAAAGIYALDNNIARLSEDHQHVQLLVAALKQKEFVGAISPAETNIIIFEVVGKYTAPVLVQKLQKNDIAVLSLSPTKIRMVVHLDVSKEMISKIIEVIHQL